MEIWIQWSLADPRDWYKIDLTPTGPGAKAWEHLPRRPEPKGGERIDNAMGWVYDVACQGIWMGGVDHIWAEPMSNGGIEVTAWNDDPEDFPEGTRWARVMTFAPDFTQTKTYYADAGAEVRALGPHIHSGPNGVPHEVEFLPWEDFDPPPLALHGIWLPDELDRRHIEARRLPSWKEWL